MSLKKFLLIVLSILLVASMMTIPAFAADDDPVVSQLRGAPGEVVYLTINAGETFEATAIAVAITVPEGLTFVEEESEWLVENEVASVESDKAVMGVASSQYFVGDLLTLAYQVDPEAQEGQEYLVEMTCAAENGTEEVFSIRGNVVVTADSSARELTLNHSAANLDLSVENVLELKAQILPENTKDTLTWTSSNPDVATVENGIVTAHKKGQAIITATVGELSAKCQILVDCSHTNRREIMGKDSTCVEAGYEPYFQCACGPFIYVDGEYVSVTMEQLARPLADHSYVWITDKEATETETGLKHEMCSVCGIERSLGTVIDKLPQSHVHGSLTYHKAVAATCTSAGTKVYYSCSCGQLFADAQAKTPTTLEELTVAKKDHSYQWVVDKEATETATGLKHEECTACKAKRSEGTVIEKLAHVHSGITHHAALAATCVKTGTLEYWTCGGTQCAGKFYGDKNCTKTHARYTKI